MNPVINLIKTQIEYLEVMLENKSAEIERLKNLILTAESDMLTLNVSLKEFERSLGLLMDVKNLDDAVEKYKNKRKRL